MNCCVKHRGYQFHSDNVTQVENLPTVTVSDMGYERTVLNMLGMYLCKLWDYS